MVFGPLLSNGRHEPKTPSFCGISGDLAQSTRKSLAIAILLFWCAKLKSEIGMNLGHFSQRQSITQRGVRAHPFTARERANTGFLQHLSHLLAANFGRQQREHPFVRYCGALHNSERTITRVSRNPTLARNKKRASLEIFCLFSCV